MAKKTCRVGLGPPNQCGGAEPHPTLSNIEIPEPSLEHLKRLTDNTGLFQHAKVIIPDRRCGYCTDDNARAVIAMTKYYSQYPEPQVLRLLDTYLAFMIHSQNEDGTVRNWMNFDRTWYKNETGNDALGRTLWACGTIVAGPPAPAYLAIAKNCFDTSVERVQKQTPKGMAYSILGMSDYLKQFPGAGEVRCQLELAADGLVTQYKESHYPDWKWFEEILTYDNAVLPHALFVAGLTLENGAYLEIAETTCEFLLADTYNGEHFSFVGCQGWHERGRPKAVFDQQPIEAGSTILMLEAAYEATKNNRFLMLQRKAFDWFLGCNDLGIPLYDSESKGCRDGLCSDGVNPNQGGESTLSFLLGLLSVIESHALIDKINAKQIPTSKSQISNLKS